MSIKQVVHTYWRMLWRFQLNEKNIEEKCEIKYENNECFSWNSKVRISLEDHKNLKRSPTIYVLTLSSKLKKMWRTFFKFCALYLIFIKGLLRKAIEAKNKYIRAKKSIAFYRFYVVYERFFLVDACIALVEVWICM